MPEAKEGQVDYRGRPRKKYQTVNDLPSLTIQSDAHQADIQEILKQYGVGGLMAANLAATDAQFMDVSEHTDYAELMRTVKAAESEFMKLPSKVREEFDHDVAKWLDAAHDQDKEDAIISDIVEKSGEEAPVEPVEEPGPPE